MFPMAAMYADGALRLANERLDGFRAEAQRSRFDSLRPTRRRPGRLGRLLANFRASLGNVEAPAPTIRLSDYPYRP